MKMEGAILMIKFYEWKDSFPYFNIQPKGPIPTVSDEDGIYPYESFCETAARPVLKKFKMVTMENEYISVTVCPDLGGRVDQ